MLDNLFYFFLINFPKYLLGSDSPTLVLPYFAMTKFTDTRVDVDVDHLEHYRAGKVPVHLTILYEPKIIKVGSKRHMVQFRYCPDSKKFRWKMFNRPIIRNRSTRHTVDMVDSDIDLSKPVVFGRENGDVIWTTTLCNMEDVISFLKYYDITSDGFIYAAVPGSIPIFTFGRQGLPFPPIKGKFFDFIL